jgi:ribose transport system substrate-binding protein
MALPTISKVALWAMLAAMTFSVAGRADEKGLDNPKRNPYLSKLQGKKVIFVPTARGIDLVEAWVPMMQKQANKYGYTLDIRDPNWNTDARGANYRIRNCRKA